MASELVFGLSDNGLSSRRGLFIPETGFRLAVGQPFHDTGKKPCEHEVAEERVAEKENGGRVFRMANGQRLPPAGQSLSVEGVPSP